MEVNHNSKSSHGGSNIQNDTTNLNNSYTQLRTNRNKNSKFYEGTKNISKSQNIMKPNNSGNIWQKQVPPGGGSKVSYQGETQYQAQESNGVVVGGMKEADDKFFNFFHMLGKFLYNKRIDPRTGDVRAMNKKELLQKPTPELYFNPTDLINQLPCTNQMFNEYLIENSHNHFIDLKEFAIALDTFSFTDTITKFEHKVSSYTYDTNSLKFNKTLINTMACTVINKSQYNNSTHSNVNFMRKTFQKPIYNLLDHTRIKRDNRELYIQCITRNASISRYSTNKFLLEVKPMLDILNKKKNGKIQ